ncbi:hypothetical protein [Streptomyces sp. NPDC127197]|uniref:hypothetical protein n=1 Tax=Streptomyces sp. NPDC127197 TaxID=3345388 RepID=UPI003639A107
MPITSHAVDSPATLRRTAQAASDGCPDPAPDAGQTHTYPEGSEPARVRATGQPLRLRVTADDVRLAMSAGHEPTPGASGLRSMLLVPRWARGSPLGLAQFVRRQTADSFDDELLLPRRSPPEQR